MTFEKKAYDLALAGEYRRLLGQREIARIALTVAEGFLEKEDTEANRAKVDDLTMAHDEAVTALHKHVADHGLPPVGDR